MDCMVDIETTGIIPGSGILTIGAVKFNRTQDLPRLEDCDTFYIRISPESLNEYGFTCDESSLKWWDGQEAYVKDEAFSCGKDRVNIRDALLLFSGWYGQCQRVWGNGDDFDCVLLSEAYRKTCVGAPPWQFWQTRDLRTAFDLAGMSSKDLGDDNKHHALHDAYRQVVGLLGALSRLKLVKP